MKLGRKLRVPVVITAIGSDLNRISDPLCDILTRQTLRNADFVTTVSLDLCMTARRMGSYPGATRPKLNGCDTSIFYPRDRAHARAKLGIDNDAEVIIYVGRLDLLKGLVELVHAMAHLRKTRPKAHCYLIGEGPAEAELRAEMERFDVMDGLTFVGPRGTERSRRLDGRRRSRYAAQLQRRLSQCRH